MSGIKISDLPVIPSSHLTDASPWVQGGVTYQATNNQLITLFNSNIQIAESQVTNLTTDLASKLNLSGGTMSGNINMNSVATVTGLQNPLNPGDAVNLATLTGYITNSLANGKIFIGNGSNQAVASTASYPSVATSTGSFIYANGTNFVASTSLWPNTVGTAGTILRSDGTTNAYTTSTFADTYGASTILYSNGANTVTGLATGNNGILVTSNTGVPSIATTFGQGLAVASSQLSVGGANNIPFNDGKGIQDSNGNLLLSFSKIASAVNKVAIQNNSTGSHPIIQGYGTDSNVILNLQGQGTGGAAVQGTSTNDNATAGFVGEFISSNIPSASGISISNATAKDLTSISLTAGDWDVFCNVTFQAAAGTPITAAYSWSSIASAVLPDGSLIGGFDSTAGSTGRNVVAPYQRFSLPSTTTVHVSAYCVFGSSTVTIYGGIYARRVR